MQNAIFILGVLSLVACDSDSFSEEAAYQEAMMGSEARQVVDDTVAFHKPGDGACVTLEFATAVLHGRRSVEHLTAEEDSCAL